MTRKERPAPESWDEATDVRRFWWLVAPLTFALLTIIIVALTGELRPGSQHEKHAFTDQTLDVRGLSGLAIENDWGPVTIEGGDQPTVTLRIDRKATGRTNSESERRLNSLEARVFQDGETLLLGIHSALGIFPANLSATLRITVPRHFDLRVSTGGGDIIVLGMEGDLLIRNGQSGVQVELPGDTAFEIQANVRRVHSSISLKQVAPLASWPFRAIAGDPPRRLYQISAQNGDLKLSRGG